jgi:phosphoglycerate dehydrogenase-like enzyme
MTPHIGAGTVDAQREIGREVVRLIESHETGEEAAMVGIAGGVDE